MKTADFYVYAYIRVINSKYGSAGTPYYIGEGWVKGMIKKNITSIE